MDKHPIDDLFREHLSSREWNLTEDVWKDALMAIRKDKNERKRKAWIWWLSGASGFLVIIYLVSQFFGKPNHQAVAIIDQKINTAFMAEEEPIQAQDKSSSVSDRLEDSNMEKAAFQNSFVISSSNVTDRSVSAEKFISKPPMAMSTGSAHSMEIQTVNKIDITGSTDAIGDAMRKDDAFSRSSAVPVISAIKPEVVSQGNMITQIVPRPNDIIYETITVNSTKVLRGGLVSGYTVQTYSDIYHGIASKESAFHDHAVRVGYQWAFNRSLGVELRTGMRLFSGELPVSAQVAHVSYQIGSQTTTYQLQADKLVMAGLGVVLHTGSAKHRLSFAGEMDLVIGACGDFREQFLDQERRLQDRNVKPLLVSEQRNWLSLKGINRWQPTSEIAYRYAVTPRFELGVAWLHRFKNFVAFDDIPSDRTTFTIKKIF